MRDIHKVCNICDHASDLECPNCGGGYEGFCTIGHDEQIRKQALEEFKEKYLTKENIQKNKFEPNDVVVNDVGDRGILLRRIYSEDGVWLVLDTDNKDRVFYDNEDYMTVIGHADRLDKYRAELKNMNIEDM